MPLKVYIDNAMPSRKKIAWVIDLIAENKRIDLAFANEKSGADIKIFHGQDSDFNISSAFYEMLDKGIFNHQKHFQESCMIRDANGNEDLLSTIFYCVNSIQEYQAESNDALGRFEFRNSYQWRFDIPRENLVQELIDKVCKQLPAIENSKPVRRRSKVLLTHDIDTVHGSWKEDGLYAVKHLKPGKIFNILLNEALGKPDWINMDRIRSIEDEKGFHSVFYWLLYKDQKNSDYDFKSSKIQNQFRETGSNGWENGLHKSLRATTFKEELDRLGEKVESNRYHYLNFKLPSGYAEIENSGLKMDTSLGFTEEYGFRNSYGFPFMPYNISEDRKYDFIEVPMQVMDRTFFSNRIPVHEIQRMLIDWFDRNKYDCVFSINFHNNFFSELKYNGYSELYKMLLTYFRENEFEGVTASELVKEFYHSVKNKNS